MSYDVLRVDIEGKADLCSILKTRLFNEYDIYAPINKKYHNLSLAIPHIHHNKYKETSNNTINEMFPEYGDLKGDIFIILDLEQEPEDLEKEYKKLIADVAYKRFL
jgi:hypothetical protein